MATVRLSTNSSYTLPAFASRITVTNITGNEAWVTSDGTAAQLPTTTPRTDGSNQKTLPPVVGAQIVTCPPIGNGYLTAPIVNVSAAVPTVVELEF